MKRLALQILIASVTVSALLGVFALLSREFGETQLKVLLTSFTISGAALLAMACAPAWERGILLPLPPLGVLLAIAACGMTVAAIWGEITGEAYAKTVATLSILSLLVVHTCMLALVRLEPPHLWVRFATGACAAALAAVLLGWMWGEWDPDDLWRPVGILGVLVGAGTILVPVLARMGREEVPGAARPRVRCCPFCRGDLVEGPGPVTCPHCRVRFRVHVEGPAPPPADG